MKYIISEIIKINRVIIKQTSCDIANENESRKIQINTQPPHPFPPAANATTEIFIYRLH